MNITLHDLDFQPFISAEAIADRVAAMGKEMREKFAGKRPLFVCVLKGAFIFAADLMRACDFDCEIAFVRLASYEGTQSSGNLKTLMGLEEGIEGRHLIVVEDIVDSGHTLHHFLGNLEKLKPASITLAALLVKPDALKYPVNIDYLGFEIPDKFVVGYGLDYDGLGRNLPAIYKTMNY